MLAKRKKDCYPLYNSSYEIGGNVMKDVLKILLIEDDPVACKELQTYFDNCEDMTLIGSTNDSLIGIKLVASYLPNVVLLDLELHQGGGNGFLFLNDLKKLHLSYNPYIIVTTHNMSEVTLEQARELGADFIITKYESRYSPEYIADTIRLMQGAIRRNNSSISVPVEVSPAQMDNLLQMRIRREMELIGINPKNKGFHYLIDSIYKHMQDPSINLARSLVEKYNKSEKSIERAMQNAIKRAWDTNDIDDLFKYYTARIRPDKGFPTLMEFVCYYSSKIKNDMETEKLGNKNL